MHLYAINTFPSAVCRRSAENKTIDSLQQNHSSFSLWLDNINTAMLP